MSKDLNIDKLTEQIGDCEPIIGMMLDRAVYSIYGESVDIPYMSCTHCEQYAIVSGLCQNGDNHFRMVVGEDYSIGLFVDDVPLHFNQFEMYSILIEKGLWAPND